MDANIMTKDIGVIVWKRILTECDMNDALSFARQQIKSAGTPSPIHTTALALAGTPNDQATSDTEDSVTTTTPDVPQVQPVLIAVGDIMYKHGNGDVFGHAVDSF